MSRGAAVRAKSKDRSLTYWDAVSDEASIKVWANEEDDVPKEDEALLSIETILDNSAITDFHIYCRDYPEKIHAMLGRLRPEFQELFIEYYMLGKSQNFLAETHGEIQTRVWQQLRIIEQALGAMIVFPDFPNGIEEILESAGLEQSEIGSLSAAIRLYNQTRSYAKVAEGLKVPIPTIRKAFRPAMTAMLQSKNLKVCAIGAMLRNLTYQVSLRKDGLSKSSQARLRRVKRLKFDAPETESSPLINWGKVDSLKNVPWLMLELSSDAQLPRVLDVVWRNVKRMFGKNAVQVFAPVSPDGALEFGYVLARSTNERTIRQLLQIRGISEISAIYRDDGTIEKFVEIPAADIEPRLSQVAPEKHVARVGEFVRVLTGEAKNYCGVVTEKNKLTVLFPTGRTFKISIAPGTTETIDAPKEKQAFWGVKP